MIIYLFIKKHIINSAKQRLVQKETSFLNTPLSEMIPIFQVKALIEDMKRCLLAYPLEASKIIQETTRLSRVCLGVPMHMDVTQHYIQKLVREAPEGLKNNGFTGRKSYKPAKRLSTPEQLFKTKQQEQARELRLEKSVEALEKRQGKEKIKNLISDLELDLKNPTNSEQQANWIRLKLEELRKQKSQFTTPRKPRVSSTTASPTATSTATSTTSTNTTPARSRSKATNIDKSPTQTNQNSLQQKRGAEQAQLDNDDDSRANNQSLKVANLSKQLSTNGYQFDSNYDGDSDDDVNGSEESSIVTRSMLKATQGNATGNLANNFTSSSSSSFGSSPKLLIQQQAANLSSPPQRTYNFLGLSSVAHRHQQPQKPSSRILQQLQDDADNVGKVENVGDLPFNLEALESVLQNGTNSSDDSSDDSDCDDDCDNVDSSDEDD